MHLPDYIAAHLGKPFRYGRLDCVLFAARWIQARTGHDPLAGLPPWHSERTALRVIGRVGGLEAAMDARFQRIAPAFACDGDIALRQGGLAIFSGAHIVAPGIEQLEFIDRMEAECAWRF